MRRINRNAIYSLIIGAFVVGNVYPSFGMEQSSCPGGVDLRDKLNETFKKGKKSKQEIDNAHVEVGDHIVLKARTDNDAAAFFFPIQKHEYLNQSFVHMKKENSEKSQSPYSAPLSQSHVDTRAMYGGDVCEYTRHIGTDGNNVEVYYLVSKKDYEEWGHVPDTWGFIDFLVIQPAQKKARELWQK